MYIYILYIYIYIYMQSQNHKNNGVHTQFFPNGFVATHAHEQKHCVPKWRSCHKVIVVNSEGTFSWLHIYYTHLSCIFIQKNVSCISKKSTFSTNWTKFNKSNIKHQFLQCSYRYIISQRVKINLINHR